MKTKTTLLAVAILSMIALAGNSFAQNLTPNPNAGTYMDGTLSVAQRIRLANAVVSSGTNASSAINAAAYMLMARPVVHLVTLYPGFADTVIADATLGGKLDAPNSSLVAYAIAFKTDACAAIDDKIAYLASQLDNALLLPGNVAALKVKYGGLVVTKAQNQYAAQDFAGAISTATPVLGFTSNTSEISVIFKSKVALRSPDVLAWAKLLYFSQGFAKTQAGIDAVSSAYRALDTNLVRANAFIQYQKDGVGTNPLADVALPSVTFLNADPNKLALNKAVAGDNIDALKIAVNSFASAPSGPALNSATALVAQWLRNIDGNLVRANAFALAQSQGQPFTIAELQ